MNLDYRLPSKEPIKSNFLPRLIKKIKSHEVVKNLEEKVYDQ